jgi:hypothetical protein
MSSTGSNQPTRLYGLDINGYFPSQEELVLRSQARQEYEDLHGDDPGDFTVVLPDAQGVKDTCGHLHHTINDAKACLKTYDPQGRYAAIYINLNDKRNRQQRRWFITPEKEAN